MYLKYYRYYQTLHDHEHGRIPKKEKTGRQRSHIPRLYDGSHILARGDARHLLRMRNEGKRLWFAVRPLTGPLCFLAP